MFTLAGEITNNSKLDDDLTNELMSMRWHLYMSNDWMIVYSKDDVIVFTMIFMMWWSNDNDEIGEMMIALL